MLIDSDKCMFESPATEKKFRICVSDALIKVLFLCPAEILSEGLEAVAVTQSEVISLRVMHVQSMCMVGVSYSECLSQA